MEKTPTIGFLVETFSGFTRKIAVGVGEYMRQHKPWNIIDFTGINRDGQNDPGKYNLSDLDGVIAPARYHEAAQMLRDNCKHIVVTGSYDYAQGFPCVMTDEPAIGKMAAEHFVSNGFQNFAYCHSASQKRLMGRCEAFKAAVKRAGFNVEVFIQRNLLPDENTPDNATASRDALRKWLLELPRPIALMAVNDSMAKQIILQCNIIGLKVPEDISVLGVDDDRPVCLTSNPQLSSVEHNARTIGYESAKLLDNLMSGAAPPEKPITVAPNMIIVRPSSDLLAVADPIVASAIKFIRDHASETINVTDVLAAISVSRSTLEKAFRSCLGRSIHQEIISAHISQAKHYLSETDLPIERIASKCGFQYASHLAGVFRNKTGMTCSAWRKKYQRR